jgi:hypothetical protein
MSRTTQKDIKNLLDRLNDLTGHEREPYGERTKDNKCNPNPGVYHTCRAYGGTQIVQMSSKPGCTGVSTIVSGYQTAGKCYDELYAFYNGVRAGKGEQDESAS